jgi:TatA/E family protein of Tat protein translocase
MNQNLLYAFGMPGGTELILIVVAILLLFPGNIGKLGQSLGSGIKNFRKAMQGDDVQGEDLLSQNEQNQSKKQQIESSQNLSEQSKEIKNENTHS